MDWKQAGVIAITGFGGVVIVLSILSICVGLTSKLVRTLEHKTVEMKKIKQEPNDK